MIAIVDYNMGNIRSVENALRRLCAEWVLTADADEIRRADRVLLPGVGNAAKAMRNLVDRDLVSVIKSLRHPVLGICVGMQVMCRDTEEGNALGIGLFDAHVRKFSADLGVKVPHMGWNTISNLETKLFKAITCTLSTPTAPGYAPTRWQLVATARCSAPR
jgi:glutamine amidotransferase